MSFIALAQGIVFDTTNGEGCLLDTINGECLALNQVATTLLQSGILHESREAVLAEGRLCIEASDQQLDGALQTLVEQLRARHLLATDTSQESMQPSREAGNKQGPPVEEPSSPNDLFNTSCDAWGTSMAWEVFLTGTLSNSPLPSSSLLERVYAWSHVIGVLLFIGCCRATEQILMQLHLRKIVQLIQRWEWRNVCQFLYAVRSWSKRRYSPSESVRFARRELLWCQGVVRLVAPVAMCLVRSIAFCIYLRALGLPATVVVGRERFGLVNDGDFHAWVEVAEHVVNDHDEVQTGFSVMQMVPSPDFANP